MEGCFFPKYRIILLICISSFIFADITGDIRICVLRASFQVDDASSTTGNGQFLMASEGIDCASYSIDPPPHDTPYFESQLKAVDSYYRSVSYEKFGFDLENSTIFPASNNDGYTLPNTMDYYNPYNQDEHQEERITELFRDAISIAYDLDQIEYSFYDLIIVFHAGIGQDFSLPFLDPTPEDIPSTYVDSDMILEHLGTSTLSVGNHEIEHGIILPETQNHLLYDISEDMFAFASEPCEYQYGLSGTFALMVGFAVGLPPLWDIETGESRVGIFGLMDQGSNNGRGLIPAPPTAWTRQFAGWEASMEVNFGSSVNLPSRFEDQIVKIPINDTEYFLIENRNNTSHDGISIDSIRYSMWEDSGESDFPPFIEILLDSAEIEQDENGVVSSVSNYDLGLPASGLLIWHIDENAISDGMDEYSVNGELDRLGIDLEEADGAQDIGYPSIFLFSDLSSGYFGDIWFKGNQEYVRANPEMDGLKPVFGPNSYPNTNSMTGSQSFVSISEISGPGDTMTFEVMNTLIMAGFPDTSAFIRTVFDLDNDGMNEIVGGKDSLWWAHSNELGNRNYFYDSDIDDIFIGLAQQNDSIIVFTDSENFIVYNTTGVPDSLSLEEWDKHQNRVFFSIHGIKDSISLEEINAKWTETNFDYIAGIDLDFDASPDVLGLDSAGYLYGFNSDLILIGGFPTHFHLQSPVLARNLFGDENPEIVAKSEDSSSIYVLDHQGNLEYQIASFKSDALVALESIAGKTSIVTRSSIYQFGKAPDTKGNEWLFEHGDWGRSRTMVLDYEFDGVGESLLTRSYCYPNPIRENLGTIRVETVGANQIEIKLYDLAGYYVTTLSKDLTETGNRVTEWVWDVAQVESGVYFAYVEVKGGEETESDIIKIAVIH